MDEPLRVRVTALDPMLELGALSILRSCPGIALAAAGQAEAVALVIVDRVAPAGLDLVRATASAPHRPKVVLVAADLGPREAAGSIAAGACCLLRRREATAASLARASYAAACGDCILPPDILPRLLEWAGGQHRAAAAAEQGPGAALSDRERAVLRLVADGHGTAEIARRLCYSERTVISVIHDVTARFHLRNRAHAVAFAMRAGLL